MAELGFENYPFSRSNLSDLPRALSIAYANAWLTRLIPPAASLTLVLTFYEVRKMIILAIMKTYLTWA